MVWPHARRTLILLAALAPWGAVWASLDPAGPPPGGSRLDVSVPEAALPAFVQDEPRFVQDKTQGRAGSADSREGQLDDEGRRTGVWVFRWPSGATQFEGEYVEGKPWGIWTFRHADGTLDPQILTGVYDQGIKVGPFDVGALPSEARVPGTPPPASRDTRLDSTQVEHIRGLVQSVAQANDEANRSREVLVDLGHAAFPYVLDGLRGLDLTELADVAVGERLTRGVLRSICLEQDYGWRMATDDAAVAANRLALLRWHSFWEVTGNVKDMWEFDFRLRLSRVASTPFLRHPPYDDGSENRLAFGGPYSASLEQVTRVRGEDVATARDAALDWLVRAQRPSGSLAREGDGQSRHEVGLTGLGLLAFVEAGHDTGSKRYGPTITRTISFLMLQQDPETGLFGDPIEHAFLYDHGIATLALCKAAQNSPSTALRDACTRGANYIARARNPYGAWRYEVPPNGENDTSVTGWMVRAVLAAEELGVPVDRESYMGALNWIDEVTDPETGRVGYTELGSFSSRIPRVNDQFPSNSGEALTGIGVTIQALVADDSKGRKDLRAKSLGLILAKLPVWDPAGGRADFYHWYQGSLALRLAGNGAQRATWNEALVATLLGAQSHDNQEAGSWDNVGPWALIAGRTYSTALGSLCLTHALADQ